MKYFIITLIFSLASIGAHAQVEKIQINNGDYTRLLHGKAIDGSTSSYFKYESNPLAADVVDGSQFLVEEFQPARILTSDGEVLTAQCRYDIYNDEMQVEVSPGNIRALSKRNLKAISINNEFFIYRKFVDKDKAVSLGYFQILVEGNAALFMRHYIDVRQSNDKTHPLLGNKLNKDIKLYRKKNYFYSLDDKKLMRLNPKKKVILKVLEDHKKEIEELISNLKLKVKNEKDLITIFTHFNEKNT